MLRSMLVPLFLATTATIVTLSSQPASAQPPMARPVAMTHVINGESLESLSAGATAPPPLVMFASFVGAGVWTVLLCGRTQRG